MESAKYHQLSDLPEPDYFDIELEKIFTPPPSRLSRLTKWVRRKVWLVSLLALFLLAIVLYISASRAPRPTLVGIFRPEDDPPKLQAAVDDATIPDALSTAAPPNDDSNGEPVTLGASSSEVSGPPQTNTTFALISPPHGQNNSKTEDPKQPVQLHKNPVQDTNTSSNAQPTAAQTVAKPTATQTLAKPTAATQPPKQPADKPAIQEDGGKVSISASTPKEQEPLVAIRATFFSSVEGPKACRGHPIAVIDLPKPQGQLGAQQCFNFARLATSDCGVFVANKVDGCVAQVFSETNCQSYTNTVAFVPEQRPVGGHWRSVMVQCGVPEPDPETLGKPPFVDQMTSIVDNDKAKGG